MSTDLLRQSGELAVAFGLVAAVALPLAAVGVVAARLLGRPIVPPWRHRPESWTGFDVLFLFLLYTLLVSGLVPVLESAEFFRAVYGPGFPPVSGGSALSAEATGAVAGGATAQAVEEAGAAAQYLRGMWAMVFATPLLMAAGVLIRSLTDRRAIELHPADVPGQVALGVFGWLVLTPVVFAVHLTAVELARLAGAEPQEHPLTRLGTGATPFDHLFFGLVVTAVTPVAEEYLFRGLMVRWAAGRSYRPWVLVVSAVGFALFRGGSGYAPVWFTAVLAAGLFVILRYGRAARPRFPVRTVAAVYGSAALFAAAHSGVWPSPVPLFVLGLGLGYLAARSGGIVGCVVMHGLFNAVSFVFLLRGGTG